MASIPGMAKPALPIDKQIELLVQRGLPIPLPPDDDYEQRKAEYHAAVRLLIDTNYYRLSGYWRYFQVRPGHGDNRFTAGGTVLKAMMSISQSGWKLLTPMARSLPAW